MPNTTKSPIFLKSLHFEHQTWKKELLFWQDEIVTFENRLAEVASDWTDHHVLAQLEHFQNQYIRHKEVIDTLMHDANEHEKSLVQCIKDESIAMNRNHIDEHNGLRDQMDTQRKLYQELKAEFFQYLSKVM